MAIDLTSASDFRLSEEDVETLQHVGVVQSFNTDTEFKLEHNELGQTNASGNSNYNYCPTLTCLIVVAIIGGSINRQNISDQANDSDVFAGLQNTNLATELVRYSQESCPGIRFTAIDSKSGRDANGKFSSAILHDSGYSHILEVTMKSVKTLRAGDNKTIKFLLVASARLFDVNTNRILLERDFDTLTLPTQLTGYTIETNEDMLEVYRIEPRNLASTISYDGFAQNCY